MIRKVFEFKRTSLWFLIISLIMLGGLLAYALENKERESFITEDPSTTTGLIENIHKGYKCKQYFEIEAGSTLEFISIQFATYNNQVNTEGLVFTLYALDDSQLFTTIIRSEELEDNAFYTIDMDDGIKTKSGRYYYIIEGTDAEEDGLTPAIYCSGDVEGAGYLYVDDEAQPQAIKSVVKYSSPNIFSFVNLACQLVFVLLTSFLAYQKIGSHKTISLVVNIIVFLANFIFIEWITEHIGILGIEITMPVRCMTYLLMLCVQMIIFGICGNVYLSNIITGIVFVLAALMNYFVIIYRGVTIVPSDLFAVGTLAEVADTYKLFFSTTQLVLLLWMVLWVIFNVRLMIHDQYRLKWHKTKSVLVRKAVSGVLSVTLGVAGIVVMCNPKVLEVVGITAYIWNKNDGYFKNGPFMNFMANVQYAFIKAPEGYSLELAKQYLAEGSASDEASGVRKQPNIILIMNESLADFETYGSNDVEFSEDPLPFIHSLDTNTVKGECYVSIFGSATANSEMEALTGHTMAFFPSGSIIYQQFPQETIHGLAGTLKESGYSTVAIHPQVRTNWNRDSIYESMGFERYLSEEAFVGAEVVRWTSDKATYDKIIELYESKGSDERFFVLDITMQGHGGYDMNVEFENPIYVEDADFPLAEEYLSSTYVSDKAFQYLVEYFEEQDEPVLIFMFGDHQPSVETEFFENLLGKSLTDLDLTDMQKRFVTPYVLWTNYKIKSAENKTISTNQISGLIKEYAGVELSSYEVFIQNFSETIPVINANGYMDKEGIWYSFDEESPYEELLYKYKVVQYAVYCDGLE